MPRLQGKVAIVTGGGSGIGAAIARRFMAVPRAAESFAKQTGAELKVVTVEAGLPMESAALATAVRSERSVNLAEPVGTAVLVRGYHRGGSPGVVESGSTVHRLAHAAPCAILIVPL